MNSCGAGAGSASVRGLNCNCFGVLDVLTMKSIYRAALQVGFDSNLGSYS